jgi:DnaJ-class molecular chaperone
MRITKKILDASGQNVQVVVEKEINVKPGWKDGTKITFEREGDERPGYIPADIIFTIQGKKHDKFVRDGDDLIYTQTITLTEAITGTEYTVRTLDDRSLLIQDSKITPDSVKVIAGEGMPNNKKRKNGDLRIKYRIVFPELTDSQRQQMKSILDKAKYK